MRPRLRAGLTLVELVITISLAAIIGIPTGILLSEHLTGALRARDYTVAMSLARREMERLDSLNNFCHTDLDVTAPSPPPLVGYWPGYPYDLTRIVQCQAGDCTSQSPGTCHSPPANARNGIKRIELRVTKSGSTEVQARLVTYRTKYVLFGS